MEEIIKRLCLGIIVAVSLTFPAFGQDVDPLIGSWKLNLEKSTFVGGPSPKSQIITFAGQKQTLTNTADVVDAQGRAFKQVFMHVYDGMPHSTTGSPVADATSYTRIGNTISYIRFKNGKPVDVGQVVVVPDKTYTVIQGGIEPK